MTARTDRLAGAIVYLVGIATIAIASSLASTSDAAAPMAAPAEPPAPTIAVVWPPAPADGRAAVTSAGAVNGSSMPLGATAMQAPALAASASAPACTFGDAPTPHRSPSDWARTVVDTDYRLPSGYIPPDLVSTRRAGFAGNSRIRAIVIPDLRAMSRAAAAAGRPLVIVSAYRSFADQQATFAAWVHASGRASALAASARPGHSEHQLGVAIDLGEPGGRMPWDLGDWAVRPTGAWLAVNAWRYGFVMSYPAGMRSRTCYTDEPWHYRYVGREEAAAIHEAGIAPRDFLWRLG